MDVVVKNTFVHFRREEEDSTDKSARSSSAPPTCRQAKVDDVDVDSVEASTTCQTVSIQADSSVAEVDDHLPLSAHLEQGNFQSLYESECQTLYPGNAEQQIEQMSKRVMEIWESLRNVETPGGSAPSSSTDAAPDNVGEVLLACLLEEGASAPSSSTDASPHNVGMAANAWAWMPVPVHVSATWSPTCMAQAPAVSGYRTPLKAQRLDGKAALFKPACKSCSHAHGVLASVKHTLMLLPGVIDVELQSGAEGTLTTISIQLDPEVSRVESVIEASKHVLLQAADNSETTYIMGYEAEPFKDMNEFTFATMLAACPTTWQRSACWETYQQGLCPRGKACKWQHPGKRELQPVRVTVACAR